MKCDMVYVKKHCLFLVLVLFFLNYPIVILTTCPLSFLGDLATSLWPHEIQHSWKETRHMPLRNCWFPVNYMFQLKQQRVQKQLSNLVSFSFFNNPNHTPLLSNKKNILFPLEPTLFLHRNTVRANYAICPLIRAG